MKRGYTKSGEPKWLVYAKRNALGSICISPSIIGAAYKKRRLYDIGYPMKSSHPNLFVKLRIDPENQPHQLILIAWPQSREHR